MAEKGKINKWHEKFLKWSAFGPAVLLFPEFVADPVESRILFLALVIVYWFLVFMIPHSFIRYFIKKYSIGQGVVNLCSLWSVVGMWGISFYLWIRLFSAGKFSAWTVDEAFPAGLFVIPFIALVYVAGVMEVCMVAWRIFVLLKSQIFGKKEEES